MKQITTSVGFQDPKGVVIANGTLILVLSQDTQITAGGGQVSPTPIYVPLDANGKISGTVNIWANDELTPSGTTYSARVVTSGGNDFVWGPEVWSIVGSSPIDLSAMTPSTISVSYPSPVLQNPSNTQTITGQSLTLTSTAPLTAASINTILYADGYPGADAGAQITNALAAAGGGAIILSGLGNAATAASDIVVSRPVTFIADSNFKLVLGSGAHFVINSNDVFFDLRGGTIQTNTAGQTLIWTQVGTTKVFGRFRAIGCNFVGPGGTIVGTNLDNCFYLENTASQQGDVNISNNKFFGFLHDPIWIRNANEVRIVGNLFDNCAEAVRLNGVVDFICNDNIYANTNVTTSQAAVMFQLESTAEDYPGGVGAHTYGVCSNGTLSGNSITGCPISSQAFLGHGGVGVSVTGNNVKDAYQGLTFSSFNSSDLVSANVISGNTVVLRTSAIGASGVNAGIIVTGFDATHLATGCVVSGNTVVNGNVANASAAQGAYYFAWTDGLVVDSNSAKSPAGAGIALTDDNTRILILGGSITDVVAIGGIQTGIRCTTGGTTLSGNMKDLSVDGAISVGRFDLSASGFVVGRNYGTNLSGNKYETPTNVTFDCPSIAIRGVGTGTASAGATLYLFGTGGSTVALTSTTRLNPFVVAQPGYINRVYGIANTGGVNASSGVLTLYKAGVAQSLTFTFGTGISGNDTNIAHGFIVAPGDAINFQLTTQGGETLADVDVTAIQQIW